MDWPQICWSEPRHVSLPDSHLLNPNQTLIFIEVLRLPCYDSSDKPENFAGRADVSRRTGGNVYAPYLPCGW